MLGQLDNFNMGWNTGCYFIDLKYLRCDQCIMGMWEGVFVLRTCTLKHLSVKCGYFQWIQKGVCTYVYVFHMYSYMCIICVCIHVSEHT